MRASPSKPDKASVTALLRAAFTGPLNIGLTLACAALLAAALPPLWQWAVQDATWRGSAADCRAGAGACWAFIGEKFWMSIFGLYPYEERYRPAITLTLFATLAGLSTIRALWSRKLLYAWLAAAIVMFALMMGGFAGMPAVPTRLWGGMTVTVFIAVFGLAAGYPLAILLALGRRSELPTLRYACIGLIEGVRGVPLVSLIFMAAILLPLFAPAGTNIDQLVRVQVAYTIFSAAYMAEVIRGGLQGLDRGQYEAAKSLGLSYWPTTRLIVLPQALKATIPSQVNTFITLFKDTTLVVIVGIFDFFTTLRAAMGDSQWQGFEVEGYLYTAIVYFTLCFVMSSYSRYLERVLSPERARR